MDPRDRYNHELEEQLAKKRARSNALSHVFMVVLLVFIILIHIKNNMLYDNSGFSYLVALALPISLLAILGGVILYSKYLSKLQDSHRPVYLRLVALLCTVCISIIVFAVLVSLYLSKPSEKLLAELSVAPYYITLLLIVGFFIYISPGLLDKLNGIPKYQVTMTGLYLLVALVLPVLYFTIVFGPVKEE